MIGWEGFVVVALAAYRLARIVTKDTISDPWRDALYRWTWNDEAPVERDGEWYPSPRSSWRTYVYELLTCPLCFGVWTAAGCYVLWRWSDSPAVRSALVVFAIAGVQCFIASRQDA